MSESLKQIKSRIKSIEVTCKITRAMEMVSVAKLRQVEGLLIGQRQYYRSIESMVNRLTGAGMEGRHPFLKKRSQAGIVVLCVITSDTGLCGTYNSAVIGKAEEFINSRACTGARVRIAAIGKRGLTYFSKRGCDIVYSCVDSNGRFDRARAEAISDELSRLFSANEADEVHICHMHYESLARYRPEVTRLLPFEPEKTENDRSSAEPDAQSLAGSLLPAFLRAKMRLVLVESILAEHGCRMVAMKAASDNARELKNTLILVRNKARQAAITKEVIEIISASGGG